MRTIQALLLCRKLHAQGLASLYLPPNNFLLGPSVEGRQDVLEAVAIYSRLYGVGCVAVRALQAFCGAAGVIIVWELVR